MTPDFGIQKSGKYNQKVKKKSGQKRKEKLTKKIKKVQKSVSDAGFHSIGAINICTRQESWCLLYAVFFPKNFEKFNYHY